MWCRVVWCIEPNPMLRRLANMVKMYSSWTSIVRIWISYVSVHEYIFNLSELQLPRLILKWRLKPNMFVPYVVHSMAPFGLHTTKSSIIRSYALQYGHMPYSTVPFVFGSRIRDLIIRFRRTLRRKHKYSGILGYTYQYWEETCHHAVQMVTPCAKRHWTARAAVLPFSQLSTVFFGYFDP